MLTLIVPGLIWTRQALADLTYDLPLPALSTLIGKGRLRHHPARDTAALLAESTGIAAPLPAAALRWYALREHPGESECLCLDPVRLHFEQRSVIVDTPQRLALSEDEATALAVSLAPTFAALGKLEVIQPLIWNLKLSAAAPAFPDLPSAIGRTAPSLPLESAYAPWRQAISEAQMQLHTHPVNLAREAAGRPLVNSLWPWGGGRLPVALDGRHDAIWSSSPIALGIARLLQIDGSALPERYAGTSARAPLAIIDTLEQPARSGDAMLWRDALARFEADWLMPALQELRSGRLDAVRLLAPDDAASAELQVSRGDLWRFWRKPRNVSELARA